MSRNGFGSTAPSLMTRIAPVFSTTKRREVSPRGAVRYTGCSNAPGSFWSATAGGSAADMGAPGVGAGRTAPAF